MILATNAVKKLQNTAIDQIHLGLLDYQFYREKFVTNSVIVQYKVVVFLFFFPALYLGKIRDFLLFISTCTVSNLRAQNLKFILIVSLGSGLLFAPRFRRFTALVAKIIFQLSRKNFEKSPSRIGAAPMFFETTVRSSWDLLSIREQLNYQV